MYIQYAMTTLPKDRSAAAPPADYKALTEQIPGIVYQFRLRPDGTSEIPFVSNRLRELTGLNPEEVMADHSRMFEQIPEEDRTLLEATFARSAAELRDIDIQHRATATDGRVRWFKNTARPQREPDGSILWHGLTIDITDWKNDQEALQRSEEKFRLVVENANEGIVVIQDGRYKFINDCMLEIFKMSREEALSSELMSIVHPDDRQMLLDRIDKRLAGRPVEDSVVHRLINTQGDLRWVETRGVLSDWEGRPASIAFAIDITDRVRIEEDLKHSKEELDTIIKHSNELFYIHDSDHKLTYVSPTSIDILGYTPDEMMIRWTELATDNPLNRQGFEITEKTIATGEKQKLYLLELVKKNGDIALVEIDESPVLNSEGKVIGVCGAARDVTARIKTEEALKRREEQFRFLTEEMSDLVWTVDRNFRTNYVSPSVKKMLGFTPEERMRQTLDEMLTPESVQKVYDILANELSMDARGFDKDRSIKAEVEYYCKDGSTVWVENVVRAIRNDEGEFVGLHGVSRDISDRKRAEKELKESEERFRALSEESPLGVSLIDPQGRYEYVNPAFVRIFGYTLEDIKTGADWFGSAFPDEDNRKSAIRVWIDDYNRCPAGESRPRTFEVRCKDGSNKTIIFRPVTTSHGQFVFYEDITERKRAEDIIRESEARYRTLVEYSPEAIVVFDGNTHEFVDANENAMRLFGLEAEELFKIGPVNVSPPMQPDGSTSANGAMKHIRRCLAGEVPAFEWTHLNVTENREIPCEVRLVRLPSSGRDLIRASIMDISERKRAEKEKALLESQLRQAQKMEAVGTLAGGIAHDFNNLLTAILGYSELALNDAESGLSNVTKIREILKAGNRAKDLVTQILTFSRKLEPELKLIDLNQVVIQTEKMLERVIPRMIKIERHLAADLWRTNADSSQLSQVLLNLATNSKDSMPDGGRFVIETRNVTLGREYADRHAGAAPGDYVLLTVSDTGHGMDKETLEHIFDPFFTLKEVGKGTGLGLATVYGIVKTNSGYIMCYSEVGQGTTFKIYLPASRSAEVDQDETPGAEDVPGGTETILFVDDEESIRDLGREILTLRGYRVILAGTGEEALEKYQDRGAGIDLVVLDISMPGMGGRKCLRKLVKMNPEVKVIIASGYSLNGQGEDIMASGASEFVAKPFSARDLLAVVRALLDG